MPYWKNLGRTLLLEDTKDSADDLTWRLNEAGINATESYHPETDQYMITVPEEQAEAAWALLKQLWLDPAPTEDPEIEYRKNYLKSAPEFIPSEEKFRNSTSSSFVFLIAGVIVMLMAVGHFFLVLTQRRPDPLSSCITELVLGFFFTCFGFNSHQKVRMLETRMAEENSFTNQIVLWFTTIYTADLLDQRIDAASADSDISEEERFFLRRQLIQNYITREYDIADSAYLDFITDTIYKRLYYPNAVTAG